MTTNKVVYIHTPKTGGASMEYFFYNQLKAAGRNYFLSFFGEDDSGPAHRQFQYYNDELVTGRKNGNHCRIETIHKDPKLAKELRESNHFKQSVMLFGHTTTALNRVFPEYDFKYIMVLRDPIERTISNISQFSPPLVKDPGTIKFGAYLCNDVEKFSDKYWNFIYDILIREHPIRGLMVHENHYLRNCMTIMLQGAEYLDHTSDVPNVKLALENTSKTRISLYSDYNNGLQKTFDHYDIPIDMSLNTFASGGNPTKTRVKKKLGKYLNAPQKVIDFVKEHNQSDITLYDTISSL